MDINCFCRNDAHDEESRIARCVEDLKRFLHELNSLARNDINHHLSAAVNNCIANMSYFRLQEDGPKLREVSDRCPLVPRFVNYFFNYKSPSTKNVIHLSPSDISPASSPAMIPSKRKFTQKDSSWWRTTDGSWTLTRSRISLTLTQTCTSGGSWLRGATASSSGTNIFLS